jgi:hypothetical protein
VLFDFMLTSIRMILSYVFLNIYAYVSLIKIFRLALASSLADSETR